jgi:hypothetical protein
MDFNFIKKNYFELLLCIIITGTGIYKLLNSNLRQEELINLNFLSEFHSYLIIIFELSSVYFLLFAEKDIKDVYIGIYCIVVALVALYYLYNNSNILTEIRDIFRYSKDIKSIFLRLIYIYILLYVIYYKE